MNEIPETQWKAMLPKLRERCNRLTDVDLAECERRVDLLTARIQNRHWISRAEARRLVLGVMKACSG